MEEDSSSPEGIGQPHGRAAFVRRSIGALLQSVVPVVMERLRTIYRAPDLFFGVGLLLIGFLGFEAGRFCDGNEGAYLSCTRSAVYYYFDTFDTVLIVAGASLVLLWALKMKERS